MEEHKELLREAVASKISFKMDDLFGREGEPRHNHGSRGSGRGCNTHLLASIENDILANWDELPDVLKQRILSIFETRFENENLIAISLI